MKYTENMITESINIRNELVNRIDVLNKVKNVLTLPYTEVMTMQQVADFYEVPLETIDTCYKTNKDEIDMDGVTVMSPRTYKEIFKGCDSTVKVNYTQAHGKMIIHIDDNTDVVIPNRGIKVFPENAILRTGMLLTQSPVALEVRTQLINVLNVVKEVQPELVTREIDKEEALYLDIVKNLVSGNKENVLVAFQNVVDYHKRHVLEMEKRIDEIETANQNLQLVNKNLSGEITTFSDRVTANNAVRALANMVYPNVRNKYEKMWQDVYKVLRGTYHIDLKLRKSKSKKKCPALNFLKEDEWDKLNKSITAILDKRNINANDFFMKCQTV